MRIISGIHKGRKIVAPKKLPVRPTTDLAKESLFNILNNRFYFDEISVLDLFAGTGSISYEFASRGSENITAVDQDFGCVQFINKISDDLGLNIQVLKADVFKFLEHTMQKYTIIFADPPYAFTEDQFQNIHNLVFENKLLEDKGLLIIEHSKHTNLADQDYYSFGKVYGGNAFSFFENHGE